MQKQITRTVVSWGLLLMFMMISHPQNLPVLFFIVPFVLLFWSLICLWGLVALLVQRLSAKPERATPSRRLRLTVCGSVVLLIIMQSLGQLTLRDVLTILAIGAIGYLYIGRSRTAAPGR